MFQKIWLEIGLMMKKIILVGALSLLTSLAAHAHDGARLDALEKEIQELRLRVLKLEPSSGVTVEPKKTIANPDGWKYQENWRQLSKGLPPENVKKILGEPMQVNGGTITFWVYPNRGGVTFYEGKLDSWKEPRW
jgi:hypothetical protein